MSPQTDPATGLGLPRVPEAQSPDALGAQPAFAASPSGLPPITPAMPGTIDATYQAGAGMPSALYAQPQPSPVPAEAPAGAGQAAFQQPIDEDGGVLDQEWVAKAKEVVTKTRSDPYAQSKELSQLKSQYIKARYNKDIKIVED